MQYIDQLRAGRFGFHVSGGARNFPFSTTVQMGCWASQPTIQGIPGFFSGVKQPGREADHLPPPSAQVRNEWTYTATPTT